MVRALRTFFLSFTIVALLLLSTIGTTTVYADDGTETDTTDTETTGATDEEQPTTEEGTSEEAPPPAEETVADEQSLGEIMEQVPDNTTVTVLNSEGEALPLVSQETADMIESDYDPIWCPEGKPPVPGAEGCTPSFRSFTELLTYLQTNETDTIYQQAGTIYIQKDQYQGGESQINFNDYNFNEINKHNLTLQGGWNPADNTVNPVDTTQLAVPITIGSSTNPWIGSLTFNNISISGVSSQTGLTLYTQSDIDLSQVEITNSQTGADLNAGGNVTINNSKINKNKEANARVKAGGNVDITNSTFNESEGLGLEITAAGHVTLASVAANNNGVFGANIQTQGDVIISNSFFSGNTSANIVSCPGNGGDDDDDKKDDDDKDSSKDDDNDKENDRQKNERRDDNYSAKSDDDKQPSNGEKDDDDKDSSKDDDDDKDGDKKDDDDDGSSTCNNPATVSGYGLQVVTTSSITLNDVTASDNHLFGAHLEGTNIAISTSAFNNNGSGTGNEPVGRGLEIISTGFVSLFNVEASNNQLFGANIQATDGVAVGGTSFFSGNKSANIVSCPGNGGNDDDDKKDDDDKDPSKDDDDDKENERQKNERRDDNYSAKSDDDDKQPSNGEKDDDDKDSSKDDDDDKDGDKKDDDDDDSSSCNNTGTLSGYGLQVVTQGNISLDGVTASDNNLFGAHLEGASVAISNSAFNNNGSGTGNEPVGKGLEIISGSDVSLTNVDASNNQLFGANIVAISNVSISNSFFTGNKSANIVSCPGNGGDDDDDKKDDDDKDPSKDDDDDKDNDRQKNERGDNNYSAKSDDDDKDGDKKDDDDDDSSSCNNTGTLSGYGLQVVTTGSVSLNNVTASDNHLFGAHLEGSDIAISNSAFNNNGSGAGNEPVGRGLEIISTGFVSLFNVEANNNQLFGADIQSTGDVIISNSFFSGNTSTNIVSCPGNGGNDDDDKKDDDDKDGDKKDDDDDDKDNDRQKNERKDDNYSAKSDNDDEQPSNGDKDDDDKDSSKDDDDDKNGDKKDDDDDDGSSSCNPTASLSGYGLQVVTTGIVSLDGVTASNNGVNGAILNSPADITVTNSTFDGNGGTGLIITTTSGQVTLDNVTATNNGQDGVEVTGACTTTVQVIDGIYADNAEYGLNISNASLNRSGSPVFTNNGLGDVLLQNPGTCITPVTPATNNPAASSLGITRKTTSNQGGDSAHYRINKNTVSLSDSGQTFRSSILFASKTKPYKYTGGLTHKNHTH